MNKNSTIKEKIKYLCKTHNLSYKDLADRLDISSSQISRFLNGKTQTISHELLGKIAREFGVTSDYLLGLQDAPELQNEVPDKLPGDIHAQDISHIPMLLMSTAFPIGGCMDFIESLQGEDTRKMAYAEYYYFSGQHEKAVKLTELYLEHPDKMLKLSACLIYTFANLSLNRIVSARFGLEKLKSSLTTAFTESTDKKETAMLVFASTAAQTLLHLPLGDTPPLTQYLTYLPQGMQMWGCYVLAHEAYLNKEYARSLGIVQTCTILSGEIYPIAMIYLNLIAAMDAMNLEDREMARTYFMNAWEIARPDDLIEALGEHHGLLQGLIETCMKEEYPEDYERIIAITYRFSYGWRRIHNPETKEDVADNLTTMEFTIAMLANRGWTNVEIAEYMGVTPRTIKQYLTTIYNKLNIDNRKQLTAYMLR
ncbi:helix-turn-helix domain-containing protein [Dorea sp.]